MPRQEVAMNAIGRFAGVLVALASFSGCGESPTTPTPSTSPPPVPFSGDIRIKSISHEPGASLGLVDCGLPNELLGYRFCNDELRFTLDVEASRDIRNAVLRLTLFEQNG